MKLKKHAIALMTTAAAVVALPSQAVEVKLPTTVNVTVPSVTVYGRLNVRAQGADDRDTDGTESEVRSTSSRIGLKGDYAVDDGLDITYQLEWGLDIVDQDKGNDDNVTSRNQYIGLKGRYGEVRVGRHDTAVKISQGKVDQFNDLDGDLAYIFKGENRLGNTVTYLSPKFNQFQAIFTVLSEDNSKQIDDDGDSVTGLSSALMYGDSKLAKTPFYVAVAYDAKVAGYDILRISAQTKLAGLELGAMYQNQEQVEWDDDSQSRVDRDDYDGFLLSAAYPLTEKFKLKMQYQKGETEDDVKPSIYSVGLDYKLAKPATLYVYYSYGDLDEDIRNDGGNGDFIDDETWFGGGLVFNF